MRSQDLFLPSFFCILVLSLFTIPVYASEWSCVLEDVCIYCIAVDQSKPVLYVGTGGGIYKTEDRGESWVQLNKGLDDFTFVYSIVVDPKNTNIMYAGCGNGIYRSTNAGLIWEKVNQLGGLFTGTGIDPDDTQIIYVGGFKSTDGGNKWERMSIEKFSNIISDYAVNHRNTQVIYAASWSDGILKSTDSGRTWSVINKNGCYQIAIDPIHTETLLTGGVNKLYKSIDAGKTWELIERGLPKGINRSVLVDPIDHRIVYTAIDKAGVFSSKNGGEIWQQLDKGGSPFGAIYSDLAINPTDPSILYIATTKGLWALQLEARGYHSIQPLGKLITVWGNIKDF
ncbi:hypothetical protein FJZ33_01080 [Candidatus Poribacteria bacterium]|nr:hypothetical protein [Candidatus Poribacteria bacterium]